MAASASRRRGCFGGRGGVCGAVSVQVDGEGGAEDAEDGAHASGQVVAGEHVREAPSNCYKGKSKIYYVK